MYFQQKPIPGYWYSNLAGQLIQVRALVYSAGTQSRVVLEDINGKRDYVELERWRGMDLVLQSPVVEKRNLARDF
ncbi:MAG: hypothetical protein WBN51_05185 [Gammaproteobacteria bacterium]